MKAWILDTGPLVAYLDASEKQHARVAARLDTFTGLRSSKGKSFSTVLPRPEFDD